MNDPRLEWCRRQVPPEPEGASLWEGFVICCQIVKTTAQLIGATLVYLLYLAFDVE